jgi:DNA-binding IclR family transcriptional regulator
VQAEWSELLDSVLQQLRDKSGEAVVFAIPANGGMVYVRFLPSQHPVAIRQGVGSVAPMYASSLGKAWLSELASERLEFELDRIEYSGGTDNAPSGPSELRTELEMTRARGWALDEEESLPGVVCVGAPVWIGEELIGAVAISAPRDRFPVDIAGELGQQLRESVTALQGSTTLVVPSGWG